MTEIVERAERRGAAKGVVDWLKASGAPDCIFEQIEAGQVLVGEDDVLSKGI
jgi:hypothetical protein